MKKLLITGASGFIGSFLVEHALNRGYEVYAGVRKTSSRIYLQDERIRFFPVEFDNEEKLLENLDSHQFDYVIHAAGATAAKDQSMYDRINFEYTKLLYKALSAARGDTKKFVFLSSLASYGPADHILEGIISEKAKPNPVTQYGRSKLKAERFLLEQSEIPTSIIRPTAVFGPRDKDLLQVFKLIKSKLEIYLGRQTQKLTFIYVLDLVKAILDIMESPKPMATYFITDGNYYSAEEFNTIIKTKLGNRTLSLRLPIGLVRGLAVLMEGISKINGKYPALNRDKLNELLSQNWVCDIEALREDINFKPSYTLDEAVEETVNWYKQNNWI